MLKLAFLNLKMAGYKTEQHQYFNLKNENTKHLTFMN